jgi:hypothetical protein
MNILTRLHQDQQGLQSMEWLLIIVAVIIPFCMFINVLAKAIGEYYSFISQVITLPFL